MLRVTSHRTTRYSGGICWASRIGLTRISTSFCACTPMLLMACQATTMPDRVRQYAYLSPFVGGPPCRCRSRQLSTPCDLIPVSARACRSVCVVCLHDARILSRRPHECDDAHIHAACKALASESDLQLVSGGFIHVTAGTEVSTHTQQKHCAKVLDGNVLSPYRSGTARCADAAQSSRTDS